MSWFLYSVYLVYRDDRGYSVDQVNRVYSGYCSYGINWACSSFTRTSLGRY